MNKITALIQAVVAFTASTLNKVLGKVEPLLNAPRNAKQAGNKPSTMDYVKCAVGVAAVVATLTVFIMIMSTVLNFAAALLSLVFAQWLAGTIAMIGGLYFELAVIGAMFDKEAVAA